MQKSGQTPTTIAKGGCGLHGLIAEKAGGQTSRSLPESVQRQIDDHPCFSEQAHHYFARMHLAVAPACNIQCNYCNRKYDCSNESRPGVVSEVLSPQQAVKKVVAVVSKIPQLSVIGIAGPGDPLANPERTFATFRALAEKMPDLKLCVSTNGLMLPQHAEELLTHNIGHVTITINCIDPDIGARIYPWIFWNHRRIRGRKAAEILIEQQQKGLEMLVEAGALVKVNSVMIPGINDEHLKEVSRVVREKGAFVHNIIPLIADKKYGTYFSLTDQQAPGIQELQALRNACGDNGAMRMMSHCQQCRSDAVGMLSEDRHAEFTAAQIDTMEIDEAAALRKHATVQTTLHRQLELKRKSEAGKFQPLMAAPRQPARQSGEPLLMAVATKGDGLIAAHFGHVKSFMIYQVSQQGVQFLEERYTDQYCTGPTTCGEAESTLSQALRLLSDCETVLCSQIGYLPWRQLESAGVRPNSEHAMKPIEASLQTVYQDWLNRDNPAAESQQAAG